jgi:hypothetical protein
VLRQARALLGTVRGETGLPVPGARIRYEPLAPEPEAPRLAGTWREVGRRRIATSDDEGRFRFDGLSDREFRLRVVATGFVTGWFGGQVGPGETEVNLRLRRGQSIRVLVVDEKGRPVPDALVRLYRDPSITFAGHYKTWLRPDRAFTSDAAGRCRVAGLADRSYRLHAAGPGGAGEAWILPGWPEATIRLRPGWESSRFHYGTESEPVPVPPGARSFPWIHEAPEPPPDPTPGKREARLAAEETRAIAPAGRGLVLVRVLSAAGHLVPDTFVVLRGARTESEISRDGRARFALLPGRYELRASPLDFGTEAADVVRTVDVAAGTSTLLDVRMPRIHAVRVEVRDASGAPLPRQRVDILRGEKSDWERADEDGTLILFADEGERLALFARPEGEPAAHVPEVMLPPKERVVLRTPHRGEILGCVLGPDGEPVFGALVSVEREGLEPLGEEAWDGWSDAAGRFSIAGPAEATYRVTAFHRAFRPGSVRLERASAAAPVTLRLGPLVRWRGRVVDGEGRGVSGARIELESGGRVGSGDDGRFEIVLPGAEEIAKVDVRHEDFLPVTASIGGDVDARESRLSRGVALVLNVHAPVGSRFSVAFEDAATGVRLRSGSGRRAMEDGVFVCRWDHAPEGAVRVRLTPRDGEARTVEYAGREGEAVELEITLR